MGLEVELLSFCSQQPCDQETTHNSTCNAILFHGLYLVKSSPFEFQVLNCLKSVNFDTE